jgi:hypothetical protein
MHERLCIFSVQVILKTSLISCLVCASSPLSHTDSMFVSNSAGHGLNAGRMASNMGQALNWK